MPQKILMKIMSLKNQRAGHLTAAQAALEAGDTEKYQTELDAATAMNDEIMNLQTLHDESTRFAGEPQPGIPPQQQTEPQAVTDLRASREYAQAFTYALRNHITPATAGGNEKVKTLMDALTEGGGDPTGADGGFLVPVDLDTRINEVMREHVRLADLFNTESTTTTEGFRVYDTAPTKGFTKVAEMGEIPQDDQPAFSRISYKIEDYGMILPVSNDLLADNTAGLFSYISRWCGEKAVLTENLALLAILKTIRATDIPAGSELKGLKTALNVDLKGAYARNASIITNQDGYNLYDNLIDGNGRPLLQPDLRQPEIDRFRGRNRILTLDNDLLPSTGGKAPLYIGNFKMLASLIRRQAFEFASTNIGGNAWRTNSTEVRCIMRFDTIVTDAKAAIARTVDPNGAAAAATTEAGK